MVFIFIFIMTYLTESAPARAIKPVGMAGAMPILYKDSANRKQSSSLGWLRYRLSSTKIVRAERHELALMPEAMPIFYKSSNI